MLPARGKQIYDTVAGGLGMFTDPMMAIPGGLSVRALDPAVFDLYEAGQFRKLPTMFSKQAIEDYINFVNQKKQTEKKN